MQYIILVPTNRIDDPQKYQCIIPALPPYDFVAYSLRSLKIVLNRKQFYLYHLYFA